MPFFKLVHENQEIENVNNYLEPFFQVDLNVFSTDRGRDIETFKRLEVSSKFKRLPMSEACLSDLNRV